MRKKSEMQKVNEEFVKTYDDSKYPKPSVTADIVIFGMFDKEVKGTFNPERCGTI